MSGSTSLPVLLLPTAASPLVLRGTLKSVAAQSVETIVHTAAGSLADITHPYVALLLSGTVLDSTACERAVWFLHTHPGMACVTGAVRGDAAVRCSTAAQFVVARTSVVRELFAVAETMQAESAIALAIGVRRATGRGIAYITEPLISAAVDAAILLLVEDAARAALTSLGIDEASLLEGVCNGVSTHPLQRLAHVAFPPLQVRRTATKGRRVLVLVQGFPMGGYTAFNADLLPRLVRKGHAITTCSTEFWRNDWRLDDVRAAAPDVHHAHAVVPQPFVPAYIDWLITTRAIDTVLLSHSYLGYHLLPWLRARHPHAAFVDYVHTDWFEAGMYGSYATMAARWATQLDAQLATSDALVAQLVGQGCEPEAVRAAHIGIDTAVWRHGGPRLQDVRASFGATKDTLVLLFAGRVSPEKRPHLAIDVAAQLVAEGHDVVLVMAGGGPLLRASLDHAKACGLEARFHITGELDEHVLRHVYAAADVFIAPSEIEGIARALYEAMAMGCVPVVSDVGGQRELVIPGAGTLVDASRNEASPYVAGVRPYLDRAVLARTAAAARAQVVAHFDSARTVQLVEEALVLATARRPTRQATLPLAMAEELAVMGLDVIRRHVVQATTRR